MSASMEIKPRCIQFATVSLELLNDAACQSARHCWSQVFDMGERVEIAYMGIAEHICSIEGPYRWSELMRAGIDAIDCEAQDSQRHRGVRENQRAFNAYWADWNYQQQHKFDEQGNIAERLAMRQIMDAMPTLQRDALLAFAATGSRREAARLLNCGYEAFCWRIRTAREMFCEMWFYPDHSMPTKGDKERTQWDRCKAGHLLTPDNVYRCRTSRQCKECHLERVRQRRAKVGQAGAVAVKP